MCQAIREMIQDGREEGIREGILINKKEMALSLSARGISAETIAEAAKVSVALVQNWISGKDE